MTEANITDEERQLREELKWAKEALSIIENGGPHQGVNGAHADQIPVQHRAKYLECPDVSEIEAHVERLENDLRDLKGGFL